MKTNKSVSSIAYQSPANFKVQTNALRNSDAIGPCLWVAHKGEGDDKDHIHFVLIGGDRTYTTKGLGSLWLPECIGDERRSVSALFKVTKNLSDWLLYAVHDPLYLTFKGLERAAHYTFDDICVTEGDEAILDELKREARDFRSNLGDKTTKRLIMLAKAGYEWERVVLSGIVPMGQFSQALKAWAYIYAKYSPNTERDSRTVASDKCNGLRGISDNE